MFKNRPRVPVVVVTLLISVAFILIYNLSFWHALSGANATAGDRS
ncbi:hypothetical protein [Crenobacter cavernae]|nr:hypothetical protein [Crenobacter cavernae]